MFFSVLTSKRIVGKAKNKQIEEARVIYSNLEEKHGWFNIAKIIFKKILYDWVNRIFSLNKLQIFYYEYIFGHIKRNMINFFMLKS